MVETVNPANIDENGIDLNTMIHEGEMLTKVGCSLDVLRRFILPAYRPVIDGERVRMYYPAHATGVNADEARAYVAPPAKPSNPDAEPCGRCGTYCYGDCAAH